MQKIFVLKKGNIKIAKEEIIHLLNPNSISLYDNLLVTDAVKENLINRLSHTREVLDFLFKCKKDEFEEQIKKYKWDNVYKNSFSVRLHGKSAFSEKTIAGCIWNKVKNPKVNLKKADTAIEIFFSDEIMIVGIRKENPDNKFMERRPHLRPFMHPSSLNPGIARCMVNLTGIQKGTIVDPFCGSGGIMIEAGLMGLSCEGYDIDKEILAGCRMNLEHYSIKKFRLINTDSTRIDRNLEYVATDIPYMRNTKGNKENLEQLCLDFIKMLDKHLVVCAVIGFPDFIDHRKMLLKSGLLAVEEFDYYLHKSLSKKIVLIQRKQV